jgi:DNA-binding GntR family transcriptional regulator
MTEPATHRNQHLYAQLRDRICLLDYPPHTRLSEEALATEFGVSRTPIRRVLARLEDEGLVQSVHGVGTLVTDVDIHELQHVYDLRMELAQLIGTLSPATIDQTTISLARHFKNRGVELAKSPDARAFARLNMDFFAFGLSLSDNQPLRDVSERLYYRTARIWLKSISKLDLVNEIAIFQREIDETAHAIENGDTAAAGLIRRAHISMCVQRLKRF